MVAVGITLAAGYAQYIGADLSLSRTLYFFPFFLAGYLWRDTLLRLVARARLLWGVLFIALLVGAALWFLHGLDPAVVYHDRGLRPGVRVDGLSRARQAGTAADLGARLPGWLAMMPRSSQMAGPPGPAHADHSCPARLCRTGLLEAVQHGGLDGFAVAVVVPAAGGSVRRDRLGGVAAGRSVQPLLRLAGGAVVAPDAASSVTGTRTRMDTVPGHRRTSDASLLANCLQSNDSFEQRGNHRLSKRL